MKNKRTISAPLILSYGQFRTRSNQNLNSKVGKKSNLFNLVWFLP